MSQSASLIETLKACLKAEKKTYADVASALSLSEASVKRLFSERDFTLERLHGICQMLGMEISDLVERMNDEAGRLESLTIQQEREITGDLVLMLVAVCVLNRWTLAQILDFYTLTEQECVARLLRLDQWKLIDLLPGNRIKLRVGPNFQWRDNGPIHGFFRETIGQEFFDSSFGKPGECLMVMNGMLSTSSSAEFHRKLTRLAREFDDLNKTDAARPFDERHGITLVMAMRHWEYGLFQHLLKRGG